MSLFNIDQVIGVKWFGRHWFISKFMWRSSRSSSISRLSIRIRKFSGLQPLKTGSDRYLLLIRSSGFFLNLISIFTSFIFPFHTAQDNRVKFLWNSRGNDSSDSKLFFEPLINDYIFGHFPTFWHIKETKYSNWIFFYFFVSEIFDLFSR